MRFCKMLLCFVLGSAANANPDCHVANQHDTFMLAINWQPAFCKGRSNHPECVSLQRHTAVLNSFALHGLWPNKDGCGKEYNFCDSRVPTGRKMCEFPAIVLSPKLLQVLSDFMPSVTYNSCLERHEWWKHGTCSNLSEEQYFQMSLTMLDEVNNSSFVKFVQQRIGSTVQKTQLFDQFDVAFGQDAHKHITLKCRGGNLEEIRIQLPREIGASALSALIGRSREVTDLGNCGQNMAILSGRSLFL